MTLRTPVPYSHPLLHRNDCADLVTKSRRAAVRGNDAADSGDDAESRAHEHLIHPITRQWRALH